MELNQVTLPVTDVGRAVAFYRRLGFRQIVSSSHYARFECREGGPSFSVHAVEHAIGSNGVIVYFECDNVDECVAQLQDKGIVFDREPTDQRWLWREARLRDPDGNELCLYHAGVNRLHPPWRIDQTDPARGESPRN